MLRNTQIQSFFRFLKQTFLPSIRSNSIFIVYCTRQLSLHSNQNCYACIPHHLRKDVLTNEKKPLRLPARNPLERIRLPARRTGCHLYAGLRIFHASVHAHCVSEIQLQDGTLQFRLGRLRQFQVFLLVTPGVGGHLQHLEAQFSIHHRWHACSHGAGHSVQRAPQPLVLEGNSIHHFVPAFLVLGYRELHHL